MRTFLFILSLLCLGSMVGSISLQKGLEKYQLASGLEDSEYFSLGIIGVVEGFGGNLSEASTLNKGMSDNQKDYILQTELYKFANEIGNLNWTDINETANTLSPIFIEIYTKLTAQFGDFETTGGCYNFTNTYKSIPVATLNQSIQTCLKLHYPEYRDILSRYSQEVAKIDKDPTHANDYVEDMFTYLTQLMYILTTGGTIPPDPTETSTSASEGTYLRTWQFAILSFIYLLL